jgi:predicted RNA-binding protein YlxR (DUF448 family)
LKAQTALLDDDDAPGSRQRRCIVTGEILPDTMLVRFVADPDGLIVPDIAATLPGRGLWVKADRAILERAAAKNPFARAAKAPVTVSADLADRVEALLVRRMIGDLGLARKSGALIFGFDNVQRALQSRTPPAVLIEASDGAADGRRKLRNSAAAQGVSPANINCLSSAELHLALGRENVIHAALTQGRLAERLVLDARRLDCVRPAAKRDDQPARVPEKGYE